MSHSMGWHSMELSVPVIVRHCHLPIYLISSCPWAKWTPMFSVWKRLINFITHSLMGHKWCTDMEHVSKITAPVSFQFQIRSCPLSWSAGLLVKYCWWGCRSTNLCGHKTQQAGPPRSWTWLNYCGWEVIPLRNSSLGEKLLSSVVDALLDLNLCEWVAEVQPSILVRF